MTNSLSTVRLASFVACAVFSSACVRDARPPVAPEVSLSLRDATVVHVASTLATSANIPVVIDSRAETIAWCTRITVESGGRKPADSLIALVEEAIRPAGLALRRTPAGLVVSPREGAVLAPCPAAPQTPVVGEPQAPMTPTSIVAGISSSGPTIEVQRSVLRGLFDRGAFGNVRAIPVLESGHANGVRLYGIARGSVLDALGFLNGDQLVRVEDYQIHELARLLEIYARVVERDEVEVGIMRRGTPLVLRYRLVP